MKKANANNPEAYIWNIPFMGFLNMNKHCPVFMNKNDCFRVSIQRLRSSLVMQQLDSGRERA